MKRLAFRFFTLMALLVVLGFGSSLSVSKASDEDPGWCTDACDTDYTACCRRLQGGSPSCPISCTNDQAACYKKCNPGLLE